MVAIISLALDRIVTFHINKMVTDTFEHKVKCTGHTVNIDPYLTV